MSAKELTALLTRFPSAERGKAEERIADARKLGWTRIDVWDCAGDTETSTHECDLVGISPDGEFDFLP